MRRSNGRPIHCSSATDLASALVATGFSYSADRRAGQADGSRPLLPDVRDVRRPGSAAIDLCFVACGRLDAYFEEYLNSWDLAAGVLIASEAGAITSDLHGGPCGVRGHRRCGSGNPPRPVVAINSIGS